MCLMGFRKINVVWWCYTCVESGKYLFEKSVILIIVIILLCINVEVVNITFQFKSGQIMLLYKYLLRVKGIYANFRFASTLLLLAAFSFMQP